MAADSTLVQSAYRAHAYHGDKTDAAKRRLSETLQGAIGDIKTKKDLAANQEAKKQQALNKKAKTQEEVLQQQMLREREVRGKQWDKNAGKLIAADGQMSSLDYGVATDAVANYLKPKFLDGSPTEQNMALNDLSLAANEINGVKEYRLDNANLFANANKPGAPYNEDGYSLALQDDEEALEILGEHSGDNSLSINQKINEAGEDSGIEFGLYGYGDQHMSLEDASGLSEKFKVDVESKANILALQNELTERAEGGTHEDVFDLEGTRSRVTEIVRNGKSMSLMYDPLVRSKPFKDDLYDSGMLGNITYEQLGIPAEDAYVLDKNQDGLINKEDGLSPEDQQAVINEFIKSPDMQGEREAMLINYYTQFAKQGWDTKHQQHVDLYNQNNLPPSPPGNDGGVYSG